MATRYYRLHSLEAVQAAHHGLACKPEMSGSLLLGYAYRCLLRVDHTDTSDPDPVVREIDPTARPLPEPPSGADETWRRHNPSW